MAIFKFWFVLLLKQFLIQLKFVVALVFSKACQPLKWWTLRWMLAWSAIRQNAKFSIFNRLFRWLLYLILQFHGHFKVKIRVFIFEYFEESFVNVCSLLVSLKKNNIIRFFFSGKCYKAWWFDTTGNDWYYWWHIGLCGKCSNHFLISYCFLDYK